MPLSLPDYDLPDERREFRDVLRRFFTEHAPMSEVRRGLDAGLPFHADLWKRASEELALPGIAIAEAHGGQGFGLLELGLALGETGRGLAPVPLLASAGLAGRAVAAVAAADRAGEWLGPIAAGQPACLAWVGDAHDWSAGATPVLASGEPETMLSGRLLHVVDARAAERVFVVARTTDGLALYCVDAGAPGLVCETPALLDPTRDLCALHLDGAIGRRVDDGVEVAPRLEAALREATVLLCAEMVGGMQRALEGAVDYASERHQFSRAIGSFQAIKHKCADMLIAFEGARTATQAALQAAEAGDAEAAELAGVAKAQCSRAYVQIAQENMQIHGGVGYTWEYDVHLYYRRAKASEALLGDAALHEERLARSLVEGAA